MMPHFPTQGTLDIRWIPYRVVAYIQHHGPTPVSGHYTVAVADACQQYWLLDDEKEPVLMEPSQVDHLSANVYLLLLVQDSAASLASPLNPSSCSHSVEAHGFSAATKNSPGRRPGLDLQSTVSDPSSDCQFSGAHGNPAAISKPTAAAAPHPGDSHGGTLQAGSHDAQQVPRAPAGRDSLGQHG